MRKVIVLLSVLMLAGCFSDASLAQIVPERYGANPEEVTWKQTETAHFIFVFPQEKQPLIKPMIQRAEGTYQEYENRLGTSPPHKIRIYINDSDELISGIRAQNTDDDYSIWTGNPLTPPDYAGPYSRRKALRIEIAYAFQQAVEAFPIDYWYYVFSRPHRSPWSDGFISYLASPEENPLDVSQLRYSNYMQHHDRAKTSPLALKYSTVQGRSQLHYFKQLYGDDALKSMYSQRQSLFGVIPYFDFDTAFKKATHESYSTFSNKWRRHTRRKITADKSAQTVKHPIESTTFFPRNEDVIYKSASITATGDKMAVITQPTTGPFSQKLRVFSLNKNNDLNEGKIISEGYFDSQMAWRGSTQLAFAKRAYDDKKGRYYHQLFIWDARTQKTRIVDNSEGGRLPTFASGNQALAYVQQMSNKNEIKLTHLERDSSRTLYAFPASITVSKLHFQPGRQKLLVSYEDDGLHKAGLFDINRHRFVPLSLVSDEPLIARWGPKGNTIYYQKTLDGVPNIFRSRFSDDKADEGVPVTSRFYGADLWDVISNQNHNNKLLVKTAEQVTLEPETPVKRADHSFRMGVGRPQVSYQPSEKKQARQKSTDVQLAFEPYRSFSNIKWEPPFGVPYYVNSGDFGIAGYLSLAEPMRTHQFDFTGILSLADPLGKSFFYSSYVNNSFRPRLELDFNRFPSASAFFQTSRKVAASNVVAGRSLWKLPGLSHGFSTWYAGGTLRYMSFNYFDDASLRFHHPTVYLSNHKTRQTDLQVALIHRYLKPSRNTLIHPLDGHGLRASITASDDILGSQTQYARFSLDGYTILPGVGDQRFFLYANAAVDAGEPAGRDYLSFSSGGNYKLPGPDFLGSVNVGQKRFVRGYQEPLLGDRFLFGQLEYRIPFLFDTTHKVFGIIPAARNSFTLFVDGGVMGDARVSASRRKTVYRYSTGAELKHVFGFGRNFKVTAELGVGQPLTQKLSPNLFVNLKSAIPF